MTVLSHKPQTPGLNSFPLGTSKGGGRSDQPPALLPDEEETERLRMSVFRWTMGLNRMVSEWIKGRDESKD